MKLASMVISLLLVVLLFAAPAPAADLQDEILGVKWKAEVSEIKGLTELRQTDRIGFFIRPGVTHTIYGNDVHDVVYGFYAGRLFAVYINTGDPVLFGKLRDDITKRFGEPRIVQTMPNEQTTYTWKTGKVKIKLKSLPTRMKLAFYYMPLSTEVNEAQAEETAEKAWKLFPIDKNRKPEHLPSIPLFNF